MRTLHFIIQAKGGVGKSLLTYLIAQSQKDNPNSYFVDLDGSTHTSTRQLQFLDQERVEAVNLLNNSDVLIRDLLIQYLESLAKTHFTDVYLDFGAPESEQFPALISKDLPFSDFLSAIGFAAQFHVVVAGAGSYMASVSYLSKMVSVINNQFPIVVWKNIHSFRSTDALAKELEYNCAQNDLYLAAFGDFEPSSNLGANILDHISQGSAIEAFPIGAGLKMKQELQNNFKYIGHGNQA